MKSITLLPQQESLVKEIGRRQMESGRLDLAQARAAVSLLGLWGLTPQVDDLMRGGGINIIPEVDGKLFRFVKGLQKKDTKADILIHFESSGKTTEFYGWISRDETLQCLDEVLHRNAFHELTELPPEDPCPQVPCEESGVWDYESECWDCFRCGKLRYHEQDRITIAGSAPTLSQGAADRS